MYSKYASRTIKASLVTWVDENDQRMGKTHRQRGRGRVTGRADGGFKSEVTVTRYTARKRSNGKTPQVPKGNYAGRKGVSRKERDKKRLMMEHLFRAAIT